MERQTQRVEADPPKEPVGPEQTDFIARALRADFPTLSDEAVETMRRELVVHRFAKKSMVARSGERPSWVFIVAEGWVREFHPLASGESSNVRFVLPGDTCGIHRGDTSLQAGAATTVFRMTNYRFGQMTALSDEWALFRKRVLKRLLCESQNRERELLSLDARARYESLLRNEPMLDKLVPQREIASYLGITPVHLSRLRRNRPSEEAPISTTPER